MTASIYLDHGSAAPQSEAARHALVAALETFGDPLRVHAEGRAARRLLEGSRAQIAEALHAQPDEIVFTSGGTESVALAIWGGVRPIRELGDRIVTSSIEHPAVGGVLHSLEADGFASVFVPVDAEGQVDLDAFAAEVRRPGTLLASLHHANHETGTMQLIAEAGRLCREAGVLFHTDACQTVGRLPVDVSALPVDLLSLSAHKFGGPPGVGALYVRRGVPLAAYPCGDDRERRRRSGMENVPGIASMAAALAAALEDSGDQAARQWALTAHLRDGLARIPRVTVYGHRTQRVPHLVCFSVEGLDAEVLAMALDERGFQIAVGSNCSGSPHEPSPVLERMGFPGRVSFRIGLGRETAAEDVDRFLATLEELVDDLHRVHAISEAAMSRYLPERRG